MFGRRVIDIAQTSAYCAVQPFRQGGAMFDRPGVTVIGAVCLGLVLSASGVAGAGCNITIKIKNEHSEMVTVNWHHSEVIIKNGFWKKISSDLSGT